MKLWKRAAATIKDQKSLLAVGLSRRSNTGLEAAIIHATSHDDASVDYSNAHRVYKWIRSSPLNLKTLVHALSSRVNHTRSWIVALKSVMLLHGVLSCKVPAVIGEIRRLPFDLSDFSDGHSCLSKTWGFNIFVRAYFAFLHHYSLFLSDQIYRHRGNRRLGKPDSVTQELDRIQKLQSLLDLLFQIRPIADNMKKTLILEAMDCIVIESINIYGRICSNIVQILPTAGKTDAITTLKIINKATSQGEDLDIYFEFCKVFGVSNARDTPQFVRIPKEQVEAIQKMINSFEEKPKQGEAFENGAQEVPKKEDVEETKAIILFETPNLQTIITDKWEIFDEDNYFFNHKSSNQIQPLYIDYPMPDLITF